jgi:hypothetical protein
MSIWINTLYALMIFDVLVLCGLVIITFTKDKP